jgi:hypothetical protein
MRTRGPLALALALVVLSNGGLAAQEPPAAAARGRAANPRAAAPLRAAAVANALDRFSAAQARRALQLNESEYARFAPLLRSLQQVRRRNNQARHRIVQELRKMAGHMAESEPDEQALRDRLDALREHDERAAQELRAAYAALDEVLTPRQQARFRVFEEAIEARKLELLMRASGRAGGAGS